MSLYHWGYCKTTERNCLSWLCHGHASEFQVVRNLNHDLITGPLCLVFNPWSEYQTANLISFLMYYDLNTVHCGPIIKSCQKSWHPITGWSNIMFRVIGCPRIESSLYMQQMNRIFKTHVWPSICWNSNSIDVQEHRRLTMERRRLRDRRRCQARSENTPEQSSHSVKIMCNVKLVDN